MVKPPSCQPNKFPAPESLVYHRHSMSVVLRKYLQSERRFIVYRGLAPTFLLLILIIPFFWCKNQDREDKWLICGQMANTGQARVERLQVQRSSCRISRSEGRMVWPAATVAAGKAGWIWIYLQTTTGDEWDGFGAQSEVFQDVKEMEDFLCGVG